jgi:hypothetical protein
MKYRWVRLEREGVVFEGSEHEHHFTEVMYVSDPVAWRVDKPVTKGDTWVLRAAAFPANEPQDHLGIGWETVSVYEVQSVDLAGAKEWAESDEAWRVPPGLPTFEDLVLGGWHKPVKPPRTRRLISMGTLDEPAAPLAPTVVQRVVLGVWEIRRLDQPMLWLWQWDGARDGHEYELTYAGDLAGHLGYHRTRSAAMRSLGLPATD